MPAFMVYTAVCGSPYDVDGPFSSILSYAGTVSLRRADAVCVK